MRSIGTVFKEDSHWHLEALAIGDANRVGKDFACALHSVQACMQTHTDCMRVCKRTQFASVYANIHSLHAQHRNCVQGRQPLSLEGARMGASTHIAIRHIAIRPKTIQPIDTPIFVECSG
jgi:hypothetical protein